MLSNNIWKIYIIFIFYLNLFNSKNNKLFKILKCGKKSKFFFHVSKNYIFWLTKNK